jgi:DnaJ-class molecular chaperone
MADENKEFKRCNRCNGGGYIRDPVYGQVERDPGVTKCPNCKGTGRIATQLERK